MQSEKVDSNDWNFFVKIEFFFYAIHKTLFVKACEYRTILWKILKIIQNIRNYKLHRYLLI